MAEATTPMMRQYFDIKKNHKDKILFYRLGDFYEMFFDDALIASRILDLTLTGRSMGAQERAPMCGVPFHSYEAYVARLIARGYKVAICEQTEDPASAKGLVARDVVRVITPGTLTDSSMLREDVNNFLAAIYMDDAGAGICFSDISTGESYCAVIPGGAAMLDTIISECGRFSPREALLSGKAFNNAALTGFLRDKLNCAVEEGGDWRFDPAEAGALIARHFPEGAFEDAHICRVLGGILTYLEETQKNSLAQLKRPERYEPDSFMGLDHTARINLELFETMRSHEKNGSLIWALDRTSTSMGARLLRRRMEHPLLNPAAIRRRLGATEALHDDPIALGEAEAALQGISDVERLMSRVSAGTANARDLLALAAAAERIPGIRALTAALPGEEMQKITRGLDPLEDIVQSIRNILDDNPPIGITEGGMIRPGYHSELDALRGDATGGRDIVAAIQNRERERTGIKNLKVGYNRVFGYYIEVTKSYQNLVPEDYVRRQTLASAERYITEELKNLEGRILGAEERANALEHSLFCELRDKIALEAERIRRMAEALAELDVTASLARVALDYNYCKPEVDATGMLEITDGRHPVVERFVPGFVPNSSRLGDENTIALITGPNMAGKSTYMRQTALIVLMAQIGSFVPAKSAHLGICDRIFTRVGASDDLSGGQSTFMVEMREVADILKNATKQSFVILDEIGRGTSTYDGMSIARAVLEYIAKRIASRTMFATHYHELTSLAGELPGVFNLATAVRRRGEEITFLHRIVSGSADGSYGIEVAKLAGVPEEITRRARQVLRGLEEEGEMPAKKPGRQPVEREQASFADMGALELVNRLRGVDLNSIAPMAALNLLYELQIEAEKLP